MHEVTIHIGELWHTPDEPARGAGPSDGLEAIALGALAVGPGGRIEGVGAAAAMRARWPRATVVDHGSSVLLPGFVDAHVHFPQIDMIGSYGERLLGWLATHTYPAEKLRRSSPCRQRRRSVRHRTFGQRHDAGGGLRQLP